MEKLNSNKYLKKLFLSSVGFEPATANQRNPKNRWLMTIAPNATKRKVTHTDRDQCRAFLMDRDGYFSPSLKTRKKYVVFYLYARGELHQMKAWRNEIQTNIKKNVLGWIRTRNCESTKSYKPMA